MKLSAVNVANLFFLKQWRVNVNIYQPKISSFHGLYNDLKRPLRENNPRKLFVTLTY